MRWLLRSEFVQIVQQGYDHARRDLQWLEAPLNSVEDAKIVGHKQRRDVEMKPARFTSCARPILEGSAPVSQQHW